jgi:ribonuclease HI
VLRETHGRIVCSQQWPDKSFPSLTEAEAFVNNQTTASSWKSSGTNKFYAVRNGHRPGIYNDWPSAQKQITGFNKPKHKSFTTRAEAEAFLRDPSPQNGVASNPLTTGLGIMGSSLTDSVSTPPPATKKRKSAVAPEPSEPAPPGYGPLPTDAEDDFDNRIKLDPVTGQLRHKTADEMQRTQVMSRNDPAPGEFLTVYTDGSCRGNGQKGSIAGVGVYFGPQDPRYARSIFNHATCSTANAYPETFLSHWPERGRRTNAPN